MKKTLLVGFFGISTLVCKSNDINKDIIIADKDKQNSTFFKMSRNSNRVGIFDQLQLLIKVKSPKIYNQGQQSSTNYSTYSDIVELLGEPNLRIKNSCIYTLNPSNGCKAIIEFDANKNVVYLAVKDCN